ncbi:MAG: PorP/SprF family type IX secretion system membrane protein [Bacteroidota bacterium]
MKKIQIFSILLFLGAASHVEAQQLPLSTQYYQNMITLNPAFTGQSEYAKAAVSHRSMFTGVQGSPQTSYLSVDGQTAQGKMGLGIIAYHDQTDILSSTSAMVNYAYRMKISGDARLNFGLAVGVQNQSIDFDKAQVVNELDPILFGPRANRTAFNADFGVAFEWKRLQAGIAVPQLLGNNPTVTTNSGQTMAINNVQHIRGSVKYDFMISESKGIKFYPMAVVRAVKGAPIQWDANLVVDAENLGWFGLTYHSTYAFGVSAGFRYKSISAGYAHNFSTGVVNDYSKRSSEVLLTYHFGDKWREQKEWNKKMEEADQELKDESELQQEEIDSLKLNQAKVNAELKKAKDELEKNKEELKRLKDLGPSGIQNDGSEPTAESVRGTYRTAKAEDFEDENGNVPAKGFYVVIGAFGVKENADKWKAKSIAEDNVDTKIIYNTKLNVREVYVLYDPERDPAMVERLKRGSKYPTVWVQKLE